MQLKWEPVMYRTNKVDCFADTPRDVSIAYGQGRWLIRKVGREYTLKFNGETIIAHARALSVCIREAEERTGS